MSFINDAVFSMISPNDVMLQMANRLRKLRIEQNITQLELARRVGVAVGTIKRFEHSGEVQFRTLLDIAFVLGRLDDFQMIFDSIDKPKSLFGTKDIKERKRARAK